MPFAAIWMGLEIMILNEVSQTEGRQISYMWNLKKIIEINLFTKQKQTHRPENKLMVIKGEVGEKDKLGFMV